MGVVKEGAWLSTTAKLSKSSEICIEHVTENLFRSKTFRVLLFGNSTYFSYTCKNLRCVVKKSAGLDNIRSLSSIRRYFVLTTNLIVFVSQLQKGNVESGIDRLLNAEHNVENYVERLMTWMHVVEVVRILSGSGRLRPGQVVKFYVAAGICNLNLIYFFDLVLYLLSKSIIFYKWALFRCYLLWNILRCIAPRLTILSLFFQSNKCLTFLFSTSFKHLLYRYLIVFRLL